jgi:hypothetical protein
VVSFSIDAGSSMHTSLKRIDDKARAVAAVFGMGTAVGLLAYRLRDI